MRTWLIAFVVVFCAGVAQADEYVMPQPPPQFQGMAYANTPLGITQPAWASGWQQGSAYQPLPQYPPYQGNMGYGGYGGQIDPRCAPQVICSKTFVQTQIFEKHTTVTVTSRPGPSYEINHTGVGGPGYAGPPSYGYQRPPQRPWCCGSFGFVSRPIASVSLLGVGVQVNAPILVRR